MDTTDYAAIQHMMDQFDERSGDDHRPEAPHRVLGEAFAQLCNKGDMTGVQMMLDFVLTHQDILLCGVARALDMGAAYGVYKGQAEIVELLWPHLDAHEQGEVLYGAIDSTHFDLFVRYHGQVTIDPQSRQGQRLLVEAALKQSDGCARLLMPLFCPFDAQDMLDRCGQPSDWVSRRAAAFLNAHQHAYLLEQATELNTTLKQACDVPKAGRGSKKI